MSQQLTPLNGKDIFCTDSALKNSENYLDDDKNRQQIGNTLLNFLINKIDYTSSSLPDKIYVFQEPYMVLQALVATASILPLAETVGQARVAEEGNKFLARTTVVIGMRSQHFVEQFESTSFKQFFDFGNKTHDYFKTKGYVSANSFRLKDEAAKALDENFDQTLAQQVFLNYQDISLNSEQANEKSTQMIQKYKFENNIA